MKEYTIKAQHKKNKALFFLFKLLAYDLVSATNKAPVEFQYWYGLNPKHFQIEVK